MPNTFLFSLPAYPKTTCQETWEIANHLNLLNLIYSLFREPILKRPFSIIDAKYQDFFLTKPIVSIKKTLYRRKVTKKSFLPVFSRLIGSLGVRNICLIKQSGLTKLVS